MKTTTKAETRGRKPADDPKKPVTVYVNISKIDKHGGITQLKEKLIKYIK